MYTGSFTIADQKNWCIVNDPVCYQCHRPWALTGCGPLCHEASQAENTMSRHQARGAQQSCSPDSPPSRLQPHNIEDHWHSKMYWLHVAVFNVLTACCCQSGLHMFISAYLTESGTLVIFPTDENKVQLVRPDRVQSLQLFLSLDLVGIGFFFTNRKNIFLLLGIKFDTAQVRKLDQILRSSPY